MARFNIGVKEKHLPVIDSLRGVAVIGVLLYHLGVSWVPGGFLGVDVFFVISGYVITRTIIDQINLNGVLDLRRFYLARIKRLFPALIAMIMASSLLIFFIARDAAFRFLTDIPYVFLGINNWKLIYLHQDYFSHIGRPPLLQHTWTLSVELQFYLLWPIVLYFIWRRFGKKHIPAIALVLAVISGATLLILSLTRGGAANSSHIYFGSDTHSIGLFLGSALAVSWIPENFSHEISQFARSTIDAISIMALLGVFACFIFIHEGNSILFAFAFPIASLAGTLVIAGFIHPASRVASLVTIKPLLWLGERSYGIYLWHWIIFNLTRPNIDITGPTLSLNIVRILIVFAIADLSYRFVELPIRNQYFSQWLKGLRYRLPRERKRGLLILYLSISTVVIVSFSTLFIASATWHEKIIGADKSGGYSSFTGVGTNLSNLSPNDPLRSGIWLTGDSIVLGIRQAMANDYHFSVINARVGRQIGELIQVAEQDKALAKNSPVVMDVGNNNILTKSDLNTLLAIFKNQPWVVLVNTAVPRTYRQINDDLINEVAQSFKNVGVVDWNAISQGHPEYFAPDGVHLVEKGVYAFKGAIDEKIIQLEKPFR